METLKFKVGDKVRVKSLEWYNENKNLDGEIINKEGEKNEVFTKYMRCWCGDIIKIYSVKNNYYEANNGWFWYDWMLEDEPVTESLLKRNNMETKEMTKEEVFEYLKNKKIRCESKEESEKVQKKLFELGYAFRNSEKKILSTYLLYIIDNFKLLVENFYDSFVKNESKIIEPNEILAIQIKEDKPKFDPKTLQPFDRVLVRQGKHVEWVARFFDFCEDDNYYTTSGSAWVMCVPYNEETKHLHKTTEEAPEFYRI